MRGAGILVIPAVLLAGLVGGRTPLAASARPGSSQIDRVGLMGHPQWGPPTPSRPAGAGLPMSFELNRGQVDRQVRFLAHGSGYNLYLTPTEAVLSFVAPSPHASAHLLRTKLSLPSRRVARTKANTLRLHLLGANPHARLVGQRLLPGTVNYFIGANPKTWHTNIPTYAMVRYQDVYPGIDLLYDGAARSLEYSWILKPGADPRAIKVNVEGATGLRLDARGNLVMRGGMGSLLQEKPTVYQGVGSARKIVRSRYLREGRSLLTFQIGPHDASKPLVIDPSLKYSTFLGGGEGFGSAEGVAVDGAGNIIIAGRTSSVGFPTTHPLQGQYGGGDYDAFVAKLDPSGSSVLYSTYLGGSGDDEAQSVAVDGAGNAFLTGSTSSGDFLTKAAFQSKYGGGAHDAFVTELNPDGSSLIFSTFLGGSGDDASYDIALDHAGDAFITGYTDSKNFPTVNPLQAHYGGGGDADAFVSELDAGGHALVYSTYLGGTGTDSASALVVDTVGNIYVVGSTGSTNFPTVNAFQGAKKGGDDCTNLLGQTGPCVDVFVSKIGAGGTHLIYSTYLGGSQDEEGDSIAVDGGGNALVTGYTSSKDFPTVRAAQSAYGGGASDGFVAKLDPGGSHLIYSTYLGGNGDDDGSDIAVDTAGSAYLVGLTSSKNFPTVSPFQGKYGGGVADAIVAKLDTSGTVLYSTYLGGNDIDLGSSVVLAGPGLVYMTGATGSKNFPTVNAVQPAYGGGDWEPFIAELSDSPSSTATSTPSATPTSKKTCKKNSKLQHGKCVCKKGYVSKRGKCVKKPRTDRRS